MLLCLLDWLVGYFYGSWRFCWPAIAAETVAEAEIGLAECCTLRHFASWYSSYPVFVCVDLGLKALRLSAAAAGDDDDDDDDGQFLQERQKQWLKLDSSEPLLVSPAKTTAATAQGLAQ